MKMHSLHKRKRKRTRKRRMRMNQTGSKKLGMLSLVDLKTQEMLLVMPLVLVASEDFVAYQLKQIRMIRDLG